MKNVIWLAAALAVLVGIIVWKVVPGLGSGSDNPQPPPPTEASPTQQPPGPADKNVVQINMWSSGEKMKYLPQLITRFNEEGHRVQGGKKKIHVGAYTVNSGPMSQQLINKIRDGTDLHFTEGVDYPSGGTAPPATPPDIVSPSVDSWLTRVNFQTGIQVFDLQNTKSLALTPVVIATYEEMARAMGWPQKALGWADIIALAKSPKGWADYPAAKAEWGKKPLLGWTDPTISSTARSALFATYVAASGKSAEELQIDDVHRPEVQQYVENLQAAVDHYFPETLTLQSKIFLGPRFIQFVPLEEYNLVWLKQGKVFSQAVPGAKPEAKPLDRKMVAIYPIEGTVWHNNPGAILQNVSWATPERQEAASVFVDYLLETAQQEKAMDWGFRPANPNVAYGPYLSPEYGINPAEPKKLLGAVQPDVAEKIIGNWQDVKKPGVVVLVLDVSGSMAGEKLEQAKKGAFSFLDTMAGHNQVGILTFSSGINTVVDIGPITKNKFDLAAVVDSAQAGGGTALYDAVRKAVEMVDRYPLSDEAIRGVVLLTDGERNGGVVKLSDLVEIQGAQEQPALNFIGNEGENKAGLRGSRLAVPTSHPIHIFSVGYGADADLEVLRIFAEATNSTYKTAAAKDVGAVLASFGKYF